jgi:hypothetical protein
MPWQLHRVNRTIATRATTNMKSQVASSLCFITIQLSTGKMNNNSSDPGRDQFVPAVTAYVIVTVHMSLHALHVDAPARGVLKGHILGVPLLAADCLALQVAFPRLPRAFGLRIDAAVVAVANNPVVQFSAKTGTAEQFLGIHDIADHHSLGAVTVGPSHIAIANESMTVARPQQIP